MSAFLFLLYFSSLSSLLGPKVESQQLGKWSIISPNDFALLNIFPLLRLFMKLVAIIFNWWIFLYFLLCWANTQDRYCMHLYRNQEIRVDLGATSLPSALAAPSLLHQIGWWHELQALINSISSAPDCRAREAWLTGRPHTVGGWSNHIADNSKEQFYFMHFVMVIICN